MGDSPLRLACESSARASGSAAYFGGLRLLRDALALELECLLQHELEHQLRNPKNGAGEVWPPNPDWRPPLAAQTDSSREGCMEIYRDCFINKGNVNGLRFDPIHYDIEEAQKLLNLAIKKRASKKAFLASLWNFAKLF